MKIEYDVNLYKEIANFSINEVIQVANRKGRKSTIHITNITTLSWHQLQLLVSKGSDRFSKMVVLYREYSSENQVSRLLLKGKALSEDESREINRYLQIFREFNCTKHHDVNEIISSKGQWDDFKTIRSLNDHGEYKKIEGIQPQYFGIICNILEISGERGIPLDKYQKY